MNTYLKAAASLLAGLVVALAVGIGVTAALAPYIWLSPMLGIPAGLVAGVATVALAYLGLTYREERAAHGQASSLTVVRLWATVAAVVAFVLVGGAATWLLTLGTMGLASAMLTVGGPVGTGAALVAAYLTARRVARRADGGASAG